MVSNKVSTFALAFEKHLPARSFGKQFFERFAIQTSSTREATFALLNEGADESQGTRKRPSIPPLLVRDFDEKSNLLLPRIQTILLHLIYNMSVNGRRYFTMKSLILAQDER